MAEGAQHDGSALEPPLHGHVGEAFVAAFGDASVPMLDKQPSNTLLVSGAGRFASQ